MKKAVKEAESAVYILQEQRVKGDPGLLLRENGKPKYLRSIGFGECYRHPL